MSSRALVFSTPELLESILLHLSPQSLLSAQQVSHTFATTIKSSPKLQYALFFRPDPTRPRDKWLINPLLRQHFLPWFAMPDGPFESRDYEILKRMDWVSDPGKRAAFLRREASWRNMLLMQPAPKSLRVVQWTHGQGGDWAQHATASFPNDAVTMGTVYDLTERYLQCFSQSYPSFTLCVVDGENGPSATLYLRMTMQCCPREEDREEPVLRSEGADEKLNLEYKDGENDGDVAKGYHGGRISEWKTDLTEERGGVAEWEWQEWKRKRAPMEDLSADVR